MEQIAQNVWVERRPLKLAGIAVGTRMTLLKLSSGDLLLHSVVKPNDELIQQINSLGRVKYIVAPNVFHHLYVKYYYPYFPTAVYYAVPGLAEKRPDLKFNVVFDPGRSEEFSPEVEIIPIQGVSTHEFTFYHKSSKTLIITDLAFNIQKTGNVWETLFWTLAGNYKKFASTRFFKMMIRDKDLFKHSIDRILSLDVERIVLPHGELVLENPKQKLQLAFEWLK